MKNRITTLDIIRFRINNAWERFIGWSFNVVMQAIFRLFRGDGTQGLK